MRFKLVDEAGNQFPIHLLWRVSGVSESGYHAWRRRGPSPQRWCQLGDMVLLAHIRSLFKLSHETYGSPRMHVELCEEGLSVGRHRVARLMRDNGIRALQKR